MSLAMKVSRAASGAAIGGIPSRGASQFRGDPGLFGDIFGGITKIAGFIPGPIGTIARTISGAGGGTQSVPPPIPSTTLGRLFPSGGSGPGGPGFGGPMVPTPGFGGTVERFLPGGSSGFQPSGVAPSGFHLNKSDYFLRDGTFVAKGTRLVKNRRRNPLNARAASRAISRLESAKKATARINRVSIRKAPCK